MQSENIPSAWTDTNSAVGAIPSFAFDPSDPWTATFQAGLARADLSGRRVYEVGVGSGANIAFMLQRCAASVVLGSDLDPRLPVLAERLVGELVPDLLDRFRPIKGSVHLIDTPAAMAEVAVADVVVGCLPQVPDPDDAMYAEFHGAQLKTVALGGRRTDDHLAHYYPWAAFNDYPFNSVGLGLIEALIRSVRSCAPNAEVVLTFGCRIGKDILSRLFRSNGYQPEELASRIVRQNECTDISFFAALEAALRGTRYEQDFTGGFYADPDGLVLIPASEAKKRLDAEPAMPVFHEICVLRGRPQLGIGSIGRNLGDDADGSRQFQATRDEPETRGVTVETRPSAGAPAFHLVEPGRPFTVPVRNREFLAGSTNENFPESVPDIGGMIPALAAAHVDCPPSVLAAAVREVIDDTLPETGGVLLRGLPLADRAGFERHIEHLGYARAGYEGGIAVRANDTGVALNASQEDRRITLSPHNEMAYLATYPRKVFFFCESAASRGGEVPINDIRETLEVIPEHIRATFRAKRIRYHRNLPMASARGEMGWTDTFRTADRRLVEQHMITSGYAFRWDAEDGLHYHYDRDAFVAHPETGEELWFNQVTELHCSYWRSHPHFPSDLPDHEYPATTTYGDGAAIDEDLISFLRGALWTTARLVRMKPGDVLVLDNQVLQHGRLSFEGPRRHYISLTR